MRPRWSAALRMARRAALRSKARTLLILAIILLPVGGAAFIDVLARATDLSAAEQWERRYGQADVIVSPADPSTSTDAAAFLPKGSTAIVGPSETSITFRLGGKTFTTEALGLDASSPLARGILRIDEGRAAVGPSEVLVSRPLAEQLGVGIGGTVTAVDGSVLTVVGRVTRPSCLSCPVAVLPDAGHLINPAGGREDSGAVLLVDLPAGTNLARLRSTLLAKDFNVFTQSDFAQGDSIAWQDADFDPQVVGIGVLVVGLGLLEVVLLAGTAVAVGVRRQTREVGLLGATGGSAGDVRRVVLAQGLLVGVTAGVIGPALALAAVVVGRPVLERLQNSAFGAVEVPIADFVGIAVLGGLAGLAAALVPAVAAARLPVLAALSGRLTRARGRGRLPWAGLAAVGAGFAAAGVLSVMWAAARNGWVADARAAGLVDGPRPEDLSQWWPVLVLAGLAVATLGAVACTPAVVGALGRVGGGLPLAPRLALRDASRHRHRVGPAAAAVMAAVTGAVALTWLFASFDEKDRAKYTATLLPHQIVLFYGPDSARVVAPPRGWNAVVDTVRPVLPGARVVPIHIAVGGDQKPKLVERFEVEVAVGDADTVAAFLGKPTNSDVADALREGRAIVLNDAVLEAGAAETSAGPQTVRIGSAVMPATVAPGAGVDVNMGSLPMVVVSPDTARAHGWHGAQRSVLLSADRPVTTQEAIDIEQRLQVPDMGVMSDPGWQPSGVGLRWGIIGAAVLVTLGGIAISVALSAAESAPDLATLSAVGAAPRLRRILTCCQALVVGLVGTGLGVPLGSAIAVIVLSGLPAYPAVPPWSALAAIAIGAPALGALVAGALVRSRLPAVRRIPA